MEVTIRRKGGRRKMAGGKREESYSMAEIRDVSKKEEGNKCKEKIN